LSPPIGSLIVRALSDDEDARNDALADRILDATVEEAAAQGLRELALADVARRANTTRMTVYRRFGRRHHLIEAMAVREARRFIAAVGTAIAPFTAIEDQGAEAFVVGLRFMHDHPVARRAIESEAEAIIQILEAEDDLIFKMGRDIVADGLRTAGLAPPDADQVAETLARIFVSFLLLPRSVVALDDDAAARAYVRACVAPIVAASSST
jgi:TetR/AcrR family transcriptional repressor of uid operon